MLKEALIIIASFLIGSIPFAYLIGRLKGIDIRKVGTKNIGAYNVWKQVHPIAGVIVAILDAAKGSFPIWLAQSQGLSSTNVFIAGFFAVLGHCCTPFLRGKGGRGQATSFGTLLLLFPREVASAVLIWLVTYGLWKKFTWAYLIADAALILLLWPDYTQIGYVLALTALLLFTHRANLKGKLK